MTTGAFASLTAFLARIGGRSAAEAASGARFQSLVDEPTVDEPASDDAPAAVSASARTTLQIASGLHRGASMRLADAEYLVGSTPDCDVVLRDAGIEARRWRLVRGRVGYSVWEVVGDARERVQPTAVDEAARQCRATFALGPVSVVLACPLPEAPGDERSAWTRGLRRYRVPMAIAGATALMTVAIAASRWAGPEAVPDLARRVVAGSQALQKEGFDTVRFVPGRLGGLEIAGVVANADELVRLQKWLETSSYGDARSTVQQSDRLIEQLRQVLAGESLTITNQGAHVRIEGVSARLAVKSQIRALADELAGIVEIEDRVSYVVAQKPESPTPLSVRVRNVMVGKPSYFRTDTGALYFEGAVMPDGAEVLEIEETQIRFRLADKIVIYPLG